MPSPWLSPQLLRQIQGTVSLHQGHPVAKADSQEEKGLRQASHPQTLVMKMPLTPMAGGRRWTSPPCVPGFGSCSLPIFPAFSTPASQMPTEPKEFYFSLTVGAPQGLLAMPGAAQGAPEGHRAPPLPGMVTGAPGSGPGCSFSLQLQSLLRWGWSSSWGGLWVL